MLAPQSSLSAFIGSTRLALKAGTKHATGGILRQMTTDKCSLAIAVSVAVNGFGHAGYLPAEIVLSTFLNFR